MARKKTKTIVGEVAGSVSDAVASAIDAIAHPLDTATKARRALGRTATRTKRKVAVKKNCFGTLNGARCSRACATSDASSGWKPGRCRNGYSAPSPMRACR